MHHTLFEERMSIFIGLNAIFQFVGDVVLEGMGLIPPRINHLALTFLNAFISFKTLSAIQKDKFRFLHEDCQVFWVLELLLIIGDIYYSFHDDWGREFILLRLTFVCLSTFNWIFVTWIMIKYKLYHITYQGTHDEENETFIHGEENGSDKEDSHGTKSHKDFSHAAIEIEELNKKISVVDEAEDGDADTNETKQLKDKETSPALDIIDEAEDGDADTNETKQLKDKETSPALDIIDENMKDYHGNNDPDSAEDSLSDKKSKQPSYVASFKDPVSKIASAVSNGHGYHHTPVPHDDHDHDHHDHDHHLDHSHISHHSHHNEHHTPVHHNDHHETGTPNNTLKLYPNQHSFTMTQSEVP